MGSDGVAAKLDEQWRMMCPRHHHQIYEHTGDRAYCEGCGQAYRFAELVDKKQLDAGQVRPPE